MGKELISNYILKFLIYSLWGIIFVGGDLVERLQLN